MGKVEEFPILQNFLVNIQQRSTHNVDSSDLYTQFRSFFRVLWWFISFSPWHQRQNAFLYFFDATWIDASFPYWKTEDTEWYGSKFLVSDSKDHYPIFLKFFLLPYCRNFWKCEIHYLYWWKKNVLKRPDVCLCRLVSMWGCKLNTSWETHIKYISGNRRKFWIIATSGEIITVQW